MSAPPADMQTGPPDSHDDDLRNASAMAAIVVKGDESRTTDGHEQLDEVSPAVQLPGMGEPNVSLRQGLRTAGASTFVILVIIAALDALQSQGLAVLAPNIQASFHVSSGVIVFVAGISGGFIVLGIVPLGWLADRLRRGPIVGAATFFFSLMVLASGLAVNIFTFFLARFGAGISQASNQTVHPSLLADAYPIGVRGRMAAASTMAVGLAGVLSPLAMGGIATLFAARGGWRWSFAIVALPIMVVSFFAFTLPEPRRGQFEKADVLGTVIDDELPAPVSMEAAFERIMRIRTIKVCVIAFSAIGFGLFTGPVLANLFLQHQYHLDAFERGLVQSIAALGLVAVLPFVGRYYDRLYRLDPSRALRLLGLLVLPAALLTPVQYFMPNAYLWALFDVPYHVLLYTAYAMFVPVLQSVAPYRLRGLTTAVGAIYIFFIGALGGAILSALLVNPLGARGAFLAITIPATVIGGVMIIRSSRFIRNDLALVVAELQDEMDEHRRRLANEADVPAIQMSHVDFSYGHLQVLFDVSFEVQKGEVVALLGTNGAGKSTALRLLSGLGTPARGAIRLDGQTITFVAPERRAKLGIHLLQGGKGVFGDRTIADNLELGAFIYRRDRADRDRRIARAYDLFPMLADRRDEAASSLSGGQQQMLALAITLLHDPKVLMIDELSLGLAPLVVESLIEVIERLKQELMTIIIVEQSLNVAAAVAQRALFMERGQISFDGPISDLVERDDLARAVFLGSEGG